MSVENVTMQFGGVVAVDNLSLEVNEGEIVALIGPNLSLIHIWNTASSAVKVSGPESRRIPMALGLRPVAMAAMV